MRVLFPFSAVVGQERLKLALTLCAIDPGIGGVLIRGPRGVAKTTLARGLADLVPGHFVELPLGATEERVVGTLDLDAALGESRVKFSPGLLAKAHEGVLYVDEINLLADPLVDLVLDAAATGHHHVERDGVSHAHPSRFVLVGTMNPDEGELRPQLLDRFGLSVFAESVLSVDERIEIVARRLAFEANPTAFVAERAQPQRELIDLCTRARAQVGHVPIGRAVLERAAERCRAANVDGVRADLAMVRAARAHAVWHDRGEILEADLDAVADLAIDHRRPDPAAPVPPSSGPLRRPPEGPAARTPRPTSTAPAERNRGPGGPHAWDTDGRTRQDSTASPSTPGRGASAFGAASGSHPASREHPDVAPSRSGALASTPVAAVPAGRLPGWVARTAGRSRAPVHTASRRTMRAPGTAPRGPIDWVRTLARGRPRFTRDLVHRALRPYPERRLLVLVDCSASMLRGRALGHAKWLARGLHTEARRHGRAVSLISFADDGARLECTPDLAHRDMDAAIEGLVSGGGTPLCAALGLALELASPGDPRDAPQLVLLTDGRVREDVRGLARELAGRGIDRVVVDCERTPVRLGLCAALARALGARLVSAETELAS